MQGGDGFTEILECVVVEGAESAEIGETAGPEEEVFVVVCVGAGGLGEIGVQKGVEMTLENAESQGFIVKVGKKAPKVGEVEIEHVRGKEVMEGVDILPDDGDIVRLLGVEEAEPVHEGGGGGILVLARGGVVVFVDENVAGFGLGSELIALGLGGGLEFEPEFLDEPLGHADVRQAKPGVAAVGLEGGFGVDGAIGMVGPETALEVFADKGQEELNQAVAVVGAGVRVGAFGVDEIVVEVVIKLLGKIFGELGAIADGFTKGKTGLIAVAAGEVDVKYAPIVFAGDVVAGVNFGVRNRTGLEKNVTPG